MYPKLFQNVCKCIFQYCLAGLALIIMSCDSDIGLSNMENELKSIPPDAGHGFVADNPMIAKELSRLKKAVANIRTEEDVISNGWFIELTDYVPNMGYHMGNPAYLGDGEFVIEKPDAILVACGPNGKLEAIAVEYLVPVDDVSTVPAPEGFTGDADQWAPVGNDLWTLHVWIKKPNSDGIFNPTNPEVAATDQCSTD